MTGDDLWNAWGVLLRGTSNFAWKKLVDQVLCFEIPHATCLVRGPETGGGTLYLCKKCNVSFDGLRRLRRHESDWHKGMDTDMAIWMALRKRYCVFCGSTFGCAGSARNHLQGACRTVYLQWKDLPPGSPFLLVKPRERFPNRAHRPTVPDNIVTRYAIGDGLCVFCGCLFPNIDRRTALHHLAGRNWCKVAYEKWCTGPSDSPFQLCRPLRCVRARSAKLVAKNVLRARNIGDVRYRV